MIAERRTIGESRTPVLVIDNIGADAAATMSLAQRLAPFPQAGNNYPGVRRILNTEDGSAWTYVIDLLEEAKPYIAGAFDLDGFDLVEASFSLVTTPAQLLTPVQRVPHFDSVDDDFYALLHYQSQCDGTAFYCHRATGIELVSPECLDRYVALARRDAASAEPDYIRGSTPSYECMGRVNGLARRLVAYPGRLLHSGIIPVGFAGSANPAEGRLTTNIFIRGHRSVPVD